ncbi:cytochrome P450 [Diaporthe sp. PMI_573]|nr:cytochrome P450 [Diaporthaceae sp. PMI_573]
MPQGGATVYGYWLPGGTCVSIHAYTLNRRLDYFFSATSFLPKRWLPAVTADLSSSFARDRLQAMLTLSTGPRNCPGQHLAWAELRLILTRLVWPFDMSLVTDRRLRWEDLCTFLWVEKKPVVVKMSLRH